MNGSSWPQKVSRIHPALLLSFACLLLGPVACEPTVIWEKSYPLRGAFPYPRDITSLTDGGFLLVGYSADKGGNVYVLKIDGEGNKSWAKTYGGPGDDQGMAGIQDVTGYLIAGQTQSAGAGSYDAYLICLDSEGDRLWEMTFGGEGSDGLSEVARLGDVIVAVGGTRSFGAGKADVMLLGIADNGELLWNRTYGSELFEYATFAARSGSGLLVGGRSEDQLLLLEVDVHGNLLWQRTYDTQGMGCMVEAPSGGFFLAGYDDDDIRIIRISPSGDLVWEETFGDPTRDDDAYCIVATDDGGCIVGGRTYDTSQWVDDYVLFKVDQDGNRIWERSYDPGTKEGGINGLAWAGGNEYVATGWKGNDAYVMRFKDMAEVHLPLTGLLAATLLIRKRHREERR